MTTDVAKNRNVSGAQSASEPPATSEREFLDRQARDAKAAMAHAWQDIKTDLQHGLDPRAWAREYPLATAASAVVAGFATAYSLIPSKQEQAVRKLKRLQQQLAAPAAATTPAAPDGQPSAKSAKSGILSRLGREALNTLRPALLSALTAGVTGKTMQPEPPREPDGGTAEPESLSSGLI